MHGFSHKRSKTPIALIKQQRRFYKPILRYLKLDEKERSQTRNPLIDQLESLNNSIRDTNLNLANLSSNRCAFCEAITNTEPYPFRPLIGAEPTKDSPEDDCYLWLAFSWNNYYPICEICKPENSRFFPVFGGRRLPSKEEIHQWGQSNRDKNGKIQQGAVMAPPNTLERLWRTQERPILIAPGSRVFSTSFAIDIDGLLVGKTQRALLTIEHFNLNAELTVKRRLKAVSSYWDSYKESTSLDENETFQFKNIEFGGAWYLYLRQALEGDLQDKESTTEIKRLTTLGNIKKTATSQLFINTDNESSQAGKNFLSPNLVELELDWVQEEQTKSKARQARIDSQPQLKEIKIKNFKSLEDVHIKMAEIPPKSQKEELHKTPCLLLLGENANGKSSFLEALTLGAISQKYLTELKTLSKNITPSRLITNTKYLGETGGSSCGVSEINLSFSSSTGETLSRNLTIQNGDSESFIYEGNMKNAPIYAFGAHRVFEKIDVEEDDEVTKKTKLPTISPEVKAFITLFNTGAVPIDPESWIISLSHKDRNDLVAALRCVIQLDGRFESINVVKDSKGNEYCQINLKKGDNIFIDGGSERKLEDQQKSHTIPTPLSYVSSGYRVIISLICAVIKGIIDTAFNEKNQNITVNEALETSVLIVIDEIEVHLHPRWKLEIISGLRRALPNATLVMSSHDPLCIRGMNKHEVVVFNRFQLDRKSPKECVELIKDFPDFEKMTIEDLLTSDLFQLYSANDHQTEKKLYQWAKLLAHMKANPKAELLDSEREMIREFKNFTKSMLPEGMMDVEGVIQQAVAEFIIERRGSNANAKEARERAITAIKKQLAAISGDEDA